MKKMYMIVATVFVANLGIAQDSNDSLTFESITLSPNSYYNGADGAGEIQIGNFNLTNFYDPQYDYFNGFAVSNISNVTTPGYTNQYASFTGSGSNSENYGIFYSYGTIAFPTEYFISHLEITNTTFAAISMRDGDSYGKQFGSPNNADGQPDGTNGEDYFLLKIIPLDNQDLAMGDTIDFYLADFRFSDNSLDYILDTWNEVVFPNGGIIANKLKFELFSSDTGAFGINTPTYFALDNLVAVPTVGLTENELIWSMHPNPTNGKITIQSENDGEIIITNSIGAIVYSATIQNSKSIDISNLPTGVYFTTLKTTNSSAVQKLTKH